MKFFFAVILSFTFLFASSPINFTKKEQLWLKSNPDIQLAIIANQKPVTITENNITTGIVPDYIDYINKQIGQDIKLVPYPNFQSAVKATNNKKIYGTAAIFKLDIFKNKFHFTVPYMETSFNFFVNKEHESKIKSEKDLKGKTLLILKNHLKLIDYAKEIKGVKILYAKSIKEQFEMLQYNKVDVVVGYMNYHYLLDKMFFNKVTFAFSANNTFGVRMGINAKHKVLTQILNKVLLKLPKYKKQQILNKWLKTKNLNNYLTFDERKWLKENHTVKVRVGNWPPFQMNTNDSFEGISVEYIKRIFDKYNIKYQFVPSQKISWKKALNSIANKKGIDVLLTASITPQRAENMLFTDNYIAPPWVIFTKDNHDFISKVEDLEGKIVAVQDGYIMQKMLTNKYPKINLKNIKSSRATEDAMKSVALGEADAFIGNLATGSYISKNLHLDNIKVAAPTEFGNHENSMAIRNDWAPLVSLINKEFKLINSSNEKDAIYNKYLSIKYEHGISFLDVIKWIGIIVLVFVSIVVIIGISNRKLTSEIKRRKKLEEETKEYISIINKHVITSSVDLNGNIVAVSNAFCEISKYTQNELLGKTHNDMKHPDIPDSFYSHILEVILSGNTWTGEIINQDKNKNDYWVKAFISPRYDNNKHIIGYTSIRQDITDKKIIEKLSITDSLTSIYNRRYFNDIMKKEINRVKRRNSYLTFVLIDIDYFKQYNDTYGHQMGDIALIEVSKTLKNTLNRAGDYCFRLGGEEFGVVFIDLNENESLFLTEVFRKNIETLHIKHEKNNASKFLTASFGLVCKKGEKVISIDSVYKEADDLLYQAKANGRNRICYNFQSYREPL